MQTHAVSTMYYISTDVGVDSSSRFLRTARTDRRTNKQTNTQIADASERFTTGVGSYQISCGKIVIALYMLQSGV